MKSGSVTRASGSGCRGGFSVSTSSRLRCFASPTLGVTLGSCVSAVACKCEMKDLVLSLVFLRPYLDGSLDMSCVKVVRVACGLEHFLARPHLDGSKVLNLEKAVWTSDPASTDSLTRSSASTNFGINSMTGAISLYGMTTTPSTGSQKTISPGATVTPCIVTGMLCA